LAVIAAGFDLRCAVHATAAIHFIDFGPECVRRCACTFGGMKEPSVKRQRTLALHERALRFSVNVNSACPRHFSDLPSHTVWGQLIRAADSTSNNLIEADDASSDADFLNKMGIALREVKEARAGLIKVKLGNLDHHDETAAKELESESTQLAAIFSTIIRNMRSRLESERRRPPSNKR